MSQGVVGYYNSDNHVFICVDCNSDAGNWRDGIPRVVAGDIPIEYREAKEDCTVCDWCRKRLTKSNGRD